MYSTTQTFSLKRPAGGAVVAPPRLDKGDMEGGVEDIPVKILGSGRMGGGDQAKVVEDTVE